MLDIRIPVETKKTMLPLHQFAVDELWFIPRPWPLGWEWYYDFPDIWRDIRRTINRWGRMLWARSGRAVGYSITKEKATFEIETAYVPVNDIREAVGKLPFASLVMREPIMIVVGAEEYYQLQRMEQEFLGLRIEYQVGKGPNIFLFSIPVILSRLHSGMVILPDMTGGCTYRLIDTNPRYMDRRLNFEPDAYMPRWRNK